MNKQELKGQRPFMQHSRRLVGLAIVLMGSGLMIQQQWPF